ncbi:MAG: hypothetical protein ACI9MR_005043, partial [Myxococcota bacterium]
MSIPAREPGHRPWSPMSWNSYPVADADDRNSYVTWNVGMYDRAPDRTRPVRLEATLELRHPDARGLPADEELEALEAFRDALEADVVQATDGRYVLRITGDGSQRHIFYAPTARGLFRKKTAQTLFAQTVGALAKEFPDYPLSVADASDEDWETYLGAFPSEDPIQWFADARAVSALVLAGDPLTGPRAVDHTLYFADEAGRDATVEAATAAGFSVVDATDSVLPAAEAPREEDEDEAEDEEPAFTVILRRTEPSVFLYPLHKAVMVLVEALG